MDKVDFIERVRKMKVPVIREFDPGFWCDLISTQFEVADSAPGKQNNKFCTPSVKCTRHDIEVKKTLDGYYARVEKARKKYNRWMREVMNEL